MIHLPYTGPPGALADDERTMSATGSADPPIPPPPPAGTSRDIVRVVGVLLVVAALLGSAALVRHGHPAHAGGGVTTIRAAIGSEKQDFFDDPKVVAALRRHGYRVQPDYMGSRQMATSANLSRYDVAFPSSQPAADAVQQRAAGADQHAAAGQSREVRVFSSPMAVATFLPVARLLAQLGIARQGAGGIWTFDVRRYLDVADTGLRWNQIAGNAAYPSPNRVLLSTTDPRKSNSADMFVALTSFVLNGDSPVTDRATVNRDVPRIASLFLNQGYTDSTSQDPFSEYLTAGMARVPMALVYEAQYLGTQLGDPSLLGADRVLMYPTPTVFSDHTLVLVRRSARLDAFASLLTGDADLLTLEAEHGFRTLRGSAFGRQVSAHHLTVPTGQPELSPASPPTYEILESFLDAIDRQYENG